MPDNNISNPVCRARGYHDWRTTKQPSLDRCASCGHTRLSRPIIDYNRRYQVVTTKAHGMMNSAARPYAVMDTWVMSNQCKGRYPTKEQAQARARTLNSRNGGK
jgi:ribosomal protein L32